VEKHVRAKQTTDENIIWRMRIACWIPKAEETLGIFNTCCWSYERSSMIRYKHTARRVTELCPTMAVEQNERLAAVARRSFFSRLISVFVFDIMQIPLWRWAPTCTAPVYRPAQHFALFTHVDLVLQIATYEE